MLVPPAPEMGLQEPRARLQATAGNMGQAPGSAAEWGGEKGQRWHTPLHQPQRVTVLLATVPKGAVLFPRGSLSSRWAVASVSTQFCPSVQLHHLALCHDLPLPWTELQGPSPPPASRFPHALSHLSEAPPNSPVHPTTRFIFLATP